MSLRSLRSALLRRGLLLAILTFAACKRPAPADSEPSSPATGNPVNASPAASAARRNLSPPPAEIWQEFSGDQAFEHVRQQVALGPRQSGSPALEKARVLIESALRQAGWTVERQTFTDSTPRGPIEFTNLIARFSPNATTQRAIVCSHYDTKRFSTIQFVGASDGASSTGALLELARVLALDPALAAQVELVFFDGEEAIVQFDTTDGLYGSRHYAQQLRTSGRAAQFKFGLLWDMIGDRDYNITLSPDSPADLARALLAAAETLGFRDRFGFFDRNIYDDHVPLNVVAKIPTIDLIDFDYLYWHTADDTLEHIGPDGLQKTGAVTLYHLRQALR